MNGINEHIENPSFKVEPWQVFDLIGGTSTGGIIAIMLGRLKMPIAECIEAYLSLSRKIFAEKFSRSWGRSYLNGEGRFDATELENAVKETVRRMTNEDPDKVLLKEVDSDCKVCVVSIRRSNSSDAIFRSYVNQKRTSSLLDACRIWEACRATSAAPLYFDSIKIGPMGQDFIDGGLRHNNPIDIVCREAKDLWPNQELFILSLGTGQAPGQKFGQHLAGIVSGLQSLATDTQNKANMFRAANPEMISEQRLFRFDVTHGLAEVGLEEYKSVDKISDATDHYLDQEDITQQRRQFAESYWRLLYAEETIPENFHTRQNEATKSSLTVRSIMPASMQTKWPDQYEDIDGQSFESQSTMAKFPTGKAPSSRKRSAPNGSLSTHSDKKATGTSRNILPKTFTTNLTPHYIAQAFRGRDENYEKLEATLNTNVASVVAYGLYGQGGVGKSQLALRYAHTNKERYTAIIWLPCSNEAKIMNACEDFIANLVCHEKPFNAEACKNVFLRWMHSSSDYLLIFDDVEDVATIESFLPTAIGCQGRVIITSRNRSIAECLDSETDELSCFTDKESADMLLWQINKNQKRNESRELALKLGKRLGGLPIVLHHVASYISMRGISIQEALETYEQSDGFLRIQGDIPASEKLSYQVGMSNIWAPTISRLPLNSRELLNILALFDPDQIPIELIEPLSATSLVEKKEGLEQPTSIRDTLIPLQNWSLVGTEPTTSSLNIHRVLQDDIKHRWSPKEQQAVFVAASNCIRATYPRQVLGTSMAKFYTKCAAYNPHVLRIQKFIEDHFSSLQIDLDLAEVLAHCGWYFFERGQLNYAESVLATAQKICISLINDDLHPVAGLIYNNIGGIYHTKGDRKKCAEYTLLAVKHRQSISRDDPEIQQLAVSYINHAGNLQSLNQHKESDVFYSKALDIRENCPGSSPELRETVLSNISSVWYKRGNIEEALPMAEKAISLHTEISPITSFMLYTTYSYANMLYATGNKDRSYELHKEVLEERINLEGAKHFMTAVSFHKVSCFEFETGYYEYAIENLRKALETFREATAEDGLLPRTCLKLAYVLKTAGQKKSNADFIDESRSLRREGKNLLKSMNVQILKFESDEELNTLVRWTYR
ncbi:hypothetical protein V495_06714 [Pseudogymnoascus sp. VKM F-4514 (FW-929)]|nr:hypothetical protein V495_06714 [Pseudogymnoascus sp. VKM F-4514 (FW-929)]KFY62224.1 hypothetical protein V497_02497 [Pseudogymnoascus sp. VKM F-4516 (FW-969)]